MLPTWDGWVSAEKRAALSEPLGIPEAGEKTASYRKGSSHLGHGGVTGATVKTRTGVEDGGKVEFGRGGAAAVALSG
jgi:hypothetical protein